MRPNFLVSTGIFMVSPSFARLVIFFAASRSISSAGSSTCSTATLFTYISMRFLSSSSRISTLSAHSGLSRRNAASMACFILSYMYSLGIPFSFSRSSIAEKNSAFIFNLPLLYYMVTCSLTCAICSFLSSTPETVIFPSLYSSRIPTRVFLPS